MTVSFDHRALLLDGRRTLVLSGAVHYPRSTPAMWPRILRHMRQSGLNTVETYIFWNLHERRRGVLDFSGRLDLVRFCRLAQAEGLNVILRIGPYICAETNYGGLPGWLRDVPDIRMRTDNEAFKREKARWVRLVAEVIRPLCAPNGGPVILAQIENEYDNIAATYGEDGRRYLRWSVELAQSLGLGIPWVTCAAGRAAEAGEKDAVASAGDSLETLNAFRAHEIIGQHFREHPEQPALWTENWAGWYQTWGGVLPKREPEELAYATARFFAAGGSGVNYFLWHGGTNFGRDGMYLLTTAYEFGGPLDEYGLPTTKARHLARLNAALAACAGELLASERPGVVEKSSGVVEYHYDSGLVFVCDDTARAVRIVKKSGEVLYDSSVRVAPVRRAWKSSGVRFAPWGWRAEPLPAAWPAEAQSAVTARKPLEQLLPTKDETDYCWYETAIVVEGSGDVLVAGRDGSPAGLERGALARVGRRGRRPSIAGLASEVPANTVNTLRLTRVADIVHVFIDGTFVATTPTPLRERRGKMDAGLFTQTFELDLKALRITPGKHRLSLLCCALGLIKGDWMIGYENMALEKKGLWAPVFWNGKKLEGEWRHQPGLLGERCGFADPAAGSLLAWKTAKAATGRGARRPLNWWRTTFTRPKGHGPWALDLGGMGKGFCWINGHCIGRYWLLPDTDPMGPWMAWMKGSLTAAPSGGPTQRYYHVPDDWLRTDGGPDTLVLFEELGGDPATVRLVRRE
ncbi:beta-galactosidase [Opitutaceae bacterium TAV1]|nr:beta-galactosidase [Opitutaceae bacterium TAV1]